MTKMIIPAVVVGLMLTPGFGASTAPQGSSYIQREVHHQLLTLSRYGVFDNIEYRVDGSQVTLLGQVTQPVLKDDAGNAVKGIEGVTGVNNQIEVLPVSPMDWGIRRAVYRAVYGDPALSRYAFQAVPSIHIIVKNGHVTLVGAVATQMDSNLANIRANSVSGVFSVKNDLHIDSGL